MQRLLALLCVVALISFSGVVEGQFNFSPNWGKRSGSSAAAAIRGTARRGRPLWGEPGSPDRGGLPRMQGTAQCFQFQQEKIGKKSKNFAKTKNFLKKNPKFLKKKSKFFFWKIKKNLFFEKKSKKFFWKIKKFWKN